MTKGAYNSPKGLINRLGGGVSVRFMQPHHDAVCAADAMRLPAASASSSLHFPLAHGGLDLGRRLFAFKRRGWGAASQSGQGFSQPSTARSWQ